MVSRASVQRADADGQAQCAVGGAGASPSWAALAEAQVVLTCPNTALCGRGYRHGDKRGAMSAGAAVQRSRTCWLRECARVRQPLGSVRTQGAIGGRLGCEKGASEVMERLV